MAAEVAQAAHSLELEEDSDCCFPTTAVKASRGLKFALFLLRILYSDLTVDTTVLLEEMAAEAAQAAQSPKGPTSPKSSKNSPAPKFPEG